MTHPRRHALAVLATLTALLTVVRLAGAVDARAEGAANAALKKAAAYYLNMNYKAAAAVLDKAARTCGANKCAPATKAAVLRDLGTMAFRKGDATGASKWFAAALTLKSDLPLNPDYDSPDLRTAWEAAGGVSGGGPGTGPSGGGQAAGDFKHTPAPEQKVNTPLPVYAEAPEDMKLVRVVAKYKGERMDDWGVLELRKLGAGWGGLIPCEDVTAGTMRYWLQGFDNGGDPVANSGDPTHPFTVPIRDETSLEAPHLPGKPAPLTCSDTGGRAHAKRRHKARTERTDEDESAERDNGDSGDRGDREDRSERKERADEGDTSSKADTEGDTETTRRHREGDYARLWLGVAGAVDFLSLPAGTDLCKLSATGAITNSANMYCTGPDGNDFPTRDRAGGVQNRNLIQGQSGISAGGVQPGDVRVMLSLDYALNPTWLLGGRFGYVINSYTGQAAVNDGRAFGAKFHLEARLTYLIGHDPLLHPGFAPMILAGLGVSEFDGSTTTIVTMLNTVANQQPVAQPANIWLTDGPFFLLAGGGARYQFSPRAAFTGALRLNIVVGGNGLLLTYGPEVGIQYGF